MPVFDIEKLIRKGTNVGIRSDAQRIVDQTDELVRIHRKHDCYRHVFLCDSHARLKTGFGDPVILIGSERQFVEKGVTTTQIRHHSIFHRRRIAISTKIQVSTESQKVVNVCRLTG